MTFKTFLIPLLASLALPVTALEYAIDPTHTYATFEIDHLGFSTQRGQFDRTSGSVEIDAEAGSGSIDITIEAASLDTGLELRDKVLRGESLPWTDVVVTVGVSALVTALAVIFVARTLRSAALK